MQMLALDELDKKVVDGLQPDWPVCKHIDYGIGGSEDVGKGENCKNALLRARNKSHRGLEDGDAGRFAAHQRTRHIEAVLRQQLVQVLVARNPARNLRITRSNQVCVFVTEFIKRSIDFGPP